MKALGLAVDPEGGRFGVFVPGKRKFEGLFWFFLIFFIFFFLE